MRWPHFAEYLVRRPDDVTEYLERDQPAPDNHPFKALFDDPEVRAVFTGERVKGARLDAATLRLYAGIDDDRHEDPARRAGPSEVPMA
jgi:hypothetical protein